MVCGFADKRRYRNSVAVWLANHEANTIVNDGPEARLEGEPLSPVRGALRFLASGGCKTDQAGSEPGDQMGEEGGK